MIILGLASALVDFLLCICRLYFLLGVTAEPVRANIGSKSATSLQRGPVDSHIFQSEGAPGAPPIIFER